MISLISATACVINTSNEMVPLRKSKHASRYIDSLAYLTDKIMTLFTSLIWKDGNLILLHMTVNVQKNRILLSFIIVYLIKYECTETSQCWIGTVNPWSLHRSWKVLKVSVRASWNHPLFQISTVTETSTRAGSPVRLGPLVYRPFLQRERVCLLPVSILWTPLWWGLFKVPLHERE